MLKSTKCLYKEKLFAFQALRVKNVLALGVIHKPCGSTRGREGGHKISTLLIKPMK